MESFLSGRAFAGGGNTNIPREQSGGFLPLLTPVASTPQPGEICNSQAEPQIEIVNGKDGIERIMIVCTCGKRIELKCEYA
jgi:hypothetical protein